MSVVPVEEQQTIKQPGRTGAAPKSRRVPSPTRTGAMNGLVFIFGAALAFWQAPFILKHLGDERYGVWTLVSQVAGYYGLLDIGTRPAVGYFVARTRAAGDKDGLSSIVSSAVGMLCLVGAFTALTGAVLVQFFPSVFGVSESIRSEATAALFIAVMLTAISFPFDVLAATMNGLRHSEVTNTASIVLRIFSLITIFLLLPRGMGLTGLATLGGTTSGLLWLYLYWRMRRMEPDLRISPRFFNRESCRKLLGYGSKSFFINIAGLLISRLDAAVIGAVLGPALVTTYVLGKNFGKYIQQGTAVITRAYTTHFAHHSGDPDKNALRALYFRGARHSAALACVGTAVATCFATPFLRLWVGERFVSGPWNERSDVIMMLLLVGGLTRVMQSITWQLLYGLALQGTMAKTKVIEGVLNLILSLILVNLIGIPGVAIGTIIPLLVTNSMLQREGLRALDLRWWEYARKGPAAGVVAGVVAAVVGLVLQLLHRPESWIELAGQVALTTGATAPIVLLFVLDKGERGKLLRVLRLKRA